MSPEDLIIEHFRLSSYQREGLRKLGLNTLENLLYYFPSYYGEKIAFKKIAELREGEKASIAGQVLSNKISKAYIKKIAMAEMMLEDETGRVKAVWFHQAYMAKKVPEGKLAKISGSVTSRKGELYFANPEIEPLEDMSLLEPGGLFGQDGAYVSYPVYGESRGVSSSWIQHAIQKLFKENLHRQIPERLPEEILAKYHLPNLQKALGWIHAPKDNKESVAARKRFAFEEIFYIQLARQKSRKIYENKSASKIELRDRDKLDDFIKHFPFRFTGAQTRALEQILGDFKKGQPMARLLEGDVGSGKTAVAATSAYAAVAAGLEVAYMAPTEILARQHFQSFIQYFTHLNINIGLITSSECLKFPSKITAREATHISKAQLLKWVANGEIPILIGTHSLIQKSVKFKNLGLAIIDEQHRFGTSQRARLLNKSSLVPHLLSMTATPIPRTLALTVYGDLDLTLLDEMPPERKGVLTEIVSPKNRNAAYEKIKNELRNGRQLFVVCPRIDEPDPTKELAVNAKSAKEEAKRLKNELFKEWEIACLHSKIKPREKEKIMQDFSAGRVQILVATSVVEVGVNVPNATMIIIEGAERFGLAQLHQLRGRVIRSTHQPYCYVFSESSSEKTRDRLHALKTARNGFELAEMDLAQRGPGELAGRKQWGISDLGMEAIKNIKMVEAARLEARRLIAEDETLASYPLLAAKVTAKAETTHFE